MISFAEVRQIQTLVTDHLGDLEKEIRSSAGSDPSFDTNRILKKQWADKLVDLIAVLIKGDEVI